MKLKTLLCSVAGLAFIGLVAAACDAPQGQNGTAVGYQDSDGSASTEVRTDPTAWRLKSDANVPIASNLAATNVMVVYDGSGSMDGSCGGDNKHGMALPAVKRVVDYLPADANLGLFVFDARMTNIAHPLSPLNRNAFTQALDNVSPGAGTPLRSAIEASFVQLQHQAHAQLGYGRYLLLIVTDGAPSGFDEDPTRLVNAIVDSTPVEVHTIGLCLDSGHVLNQPGRTFYAPASDVSQLEAGLQAVLAEAEEDSVSFGDLN